MSTSVKYMHSGMQNAPQLTNDWGVLVDMLDACLVNGFNTQTITGLSRTGTTATASFGSAHGYVQHQVIQISGVVETGWNGQYRVLATTANTLTFTVVDTIAATATGSMTAKTAPLGFEKPFSGTQKAVYRSPNPLSSRLFLRVDNSLDPVWTSTYAKYGKVTVSDGMSDVDTFTGSQMPYDSANPTKNHVGTGSGSNAINGWAKWYYARSLNSTDAAAIGTGSRSWVLIGDDRGFYFLPAWSASSPNLRATYCFNDIQSHKGGDSYKTVFYSTLIYGTAITNNMSPSSNSAPFASNKTDGLMLKPYSQSGSPVAVGLRTLALNDSTQISGNVSNNIDSPNPADNAYVFHPAYVRESTGGGVLRGEVQGAYWVLQSQPVADMTVLTDVIDSSRAYLMVANANSIIEGRVLFDITGPWRDDE